MATSNEKLSDLVEWVRSDRGKLGSIVRPLLAAPFVRGEVRGLLQMETAQLDRLLGQAAQLLGGLVSDQDDTGGE